MKKQLLLIFILSGYLCASAQEPEKIYGIVTIDDLMMKAYAKDPSAEAVVIYDIGESYFYNNEGGYDISFTRTKRVKVFTEAGIEYASVSIPYYHDGYYRTEFIREIEAASYNYENGHVVKKMLELKTVYQEVINEKWNVKKFVIPNVKEGTVFEFRYVIESPFHFNLPDWEFQSTIPTIYSKYVARMIPFYEYMFIIQGTNKLDINTKEEGTIERGFGAPGPYSSEFKFKDIIYTFGMRNVPAFRDESFITSAEDYVVKLDFQLARFNSPNGSKTEIVSTWPLLIESLNKSESFGSYLKRSRKPAEEILAGLNIPLQNSQEEKCRAIIEYIKSNYRWSEHYGKYTMKSLKEFLTERKGNPAEINLFMMAMLKAAGLEVNPVILSTRDNGKIRTNYPFESFFNYVIARVTVDNQPVLVDGTEPLLAWNRIPPRCINDKGLLIKEGEETWVSLSDDRISTDSHTIKIRLNPDSLTASADILVSADEFDAFTYKSKFYNDSVKIAESLKDNGFAVITRLKTANFKDASKPYLIEASGEVEIEALNRSLVVRPFLELPLDRNVLTQNLRTYPIDMIYASANVFISSVEIPDGFKVSAVPEDFFMDNDLMTISLKYEVKDDAIEANGNYTFKKAVYKAADYSRLRAFINTVVEKFNKEIVLESI